MYINKEIDESSPFTRDKSGKLVEDHTEPPAEQQETTIPVRQSGMLLDLLLKSKLVRETLKAKGHDREEVEKGRAAVGQDLMKLLQKLADNKPVDPNEKHNEP